MSFYTLAQLLREPESEWLDFKEKFRENSVKLVHDILCLSNSYAETDRYLVFGVANDKTVEGTPHLLRAVHASADARTTLSWQDQFQCSATATYTRFVCMNY